MRIALVLTVKNENRLLRNNILYHRSIGVDQVFVYFDGTTDNSKDSITDLSFVKVQNSVSIDQFRTNSFLSKFTTQAKEHHTARQCLNCYDAMLKAERDDYDWLIALDADELICTNRIRSSNLSEFLKNIPEEFDGVRFKVREVVQARSYYQNVFREETRFKTKRNFKRYSHNIFKSLYNPFTKKKIKHVYWYGHNTGKMAIRLNRKLIPYNPHKFVHINNEPINLISKGFVLHYHAYDASDFIKKFRNFEKRPDKFLSGNDVESIKMLFIAVVNKSGFSVDELVNYFTKYVMFSQEDLDKLNRNRIYYIFPRKKPVMEHITSVAEIFSKIEE